MTSFLSEPSLNAEGVFLQHKLHNVHHKWFELVGVLHGGEQSVHADGLQEQVDGSDHRSVDHRLQSVSHFSHNWLNDVEYVRKIGNRKKALVPSPS